MAFTLYPFSLAVVQHPETKEFLLVDEVKNRGWWLPGGHVDPGEEFEIAAIRETKEEAGIDITLKGILRVEYGLVRDTSARMRVIFFAEPTDPNQEPKNFADSESIRAKYVSMEELKEKDEKGALKYRLRGSEPDIWFEYITKGGTIFPLSILSREISLTSVHTNTACEQLGQPRQKQVGFDLIANFHSKTEVRQKVSEEISGDFAEEKAAERLTKKKKKKKKGDVNNE